MFKIIFQKCCFHKITKKDRIGKRVSLANKKDIGEFKIELGKDKGNGKVIPSNLLTLVNGAVIFIHLCSIYFQRKVMTEKH